MKFDLEQAIREWKASLGKQQGLEPGFIEEIEGNLRDRIEDYLEEGHSEKEAFLLAREKCMPAPEQLASEYYKVMSRGNKTPPWERRAGVLSKLPAHFKIAVRSLIKRRAYAILNIAGLAVSICVSFLIWLYVADQSAFDKQYENGERIYRVIYDVHHDGADAVQADVGQPVGPTLKADFPEVIEKTRLRRIGATNTLASDDLSVESADFFVTDEDFFKVFSVELLAGDKENALREPNTVVISESLAIKLLGRTDVVGEILTYSGLRPPMDIKISGVMKDLGRKTHLPVQALISYSTYFDQRELINWLRKSYTYILLNEQNDISAVRAKIPAFCDTYLREVFERRVSPTATVNLILQPLTEIYLADEYLGEPYPHGNRAHLEILTTVMVFLLLMACINYVNLATARAVDRAAEIGIKKTLGSSRRLLIAQFLSEAVLLALIAGLFSVFLSLPLLPYYSSLTGLQVDIASFLSLQNLLSILLTAGIIGLIAGVYPSIYLTSFRPIAVLKGSFGHGKRGSILRKSLIISQYVIASVLIIWILIVSQQITFMKNRDVGFDKASLIELVLPDDSVALKSMDAFLNKVRQLPQVRAVAKTTSDLSHHYGAGGQLMEGPDGQRVNTSMNMLSAGYDFIETIGATFVKGRDFDRLNKAEKAVLINAAAVKAYGWEGREFEVSYVGRDRQGKATSNWKVVGVFSDFKGGESYENVIPTIIFLNNRNMPEMKMLIGSNQIPAQTILPEVATIWDEHFVGHPFTYQFVEDKLNALYWREETFMNLLMVLCMITIFITALGVIGLISFTAETRKKEIAIRKISGARLESIILLLSKQFGLLLLLAMLIAVPVSYYLSGQWLANFTLHIEPGALSYMIAIPACLAFTVLALIYHATRAARTNPVEALRYE